MSKALKPATSRSWVKWIGIVFLVLIGLVLIYRAIAGNTLREQKALTMAQKDAKELASKPAGNPETLSVKLEQRRQETEAKMQADAGKAQATGNATVTQTPAVSGSPASSSAGTSSASMTGMVGGQAARDRMPPGTPSDAQLDSYDRLKQEGQADQARKIAHWEQSGDGSGAGQGGAAGQRSAMGLGGLGDLLSANAAGTPVAGDTGTGLNNSLIEGALRSLQQGAQPQAAANAEQTFRRQVSQSGNAPAQLLQVQSGHGRYAIHEGTSIPVVMLTAVSSDIAGPCRAQVSRDIYDSVTGRNLLVPAGSKVVCAYNAEVVQGQERLLLVFTRLILPSGASVALAGMEVADAQGAIGAPAQVNNRFWKIFGNAFLIAAVTRAAERAPASGGVTINTGSGGSSAGNTAVGVLADVTKRILDRNMNVKPELRLRPGDELRLSVTKDMVIDPAASTIN